jgi:hypothetical protein
MTSRQRAKLAMFNSVASVCSQFRHVWNQLPAFRSAFDQLQSVLGGASNLAGAQRRHTGGAAQEKIRAREELCDCAFEIAAAIRASALASGDAKAAAKLAFSVTQLRTGKDALCLERCRQILTSAQDFEKHLEGFGVTPDRLATLSRALDIFATAAENTRTLRSGNKTVTVQLPAAFKAVEDIVYNQLDNLIPQFRSAAPRFYNQYQESRIMKPAAEQRTTVFESAAEEEQMLD